MTNESKMRKVREIYAVKQNSRDDLFISCASFEDRFLGVPRILKGDICEHFILFRFCEPNERREELITEMEQILPISKDEKRYHQFDVEHGRSLESVLKLHKWLNVNKMISKNLTISIDITTFTKDLLLNLMFYIARFPHIERLRLFYTIPRRYASSEEGWLSFGIKSIHIAPMCWNEWSPVKDNLLVIILGFEEMRAWSLIEKFSADKNWLFVTKPGSRPEWDTYCERYNKRLLKEINNLGEMPALEPFRVADILSNHVTKELCGKYNVFVCPLGTKPQLIGTFHFSVSNPDMRSNIITTTVVEHLVPYYSREAVETFEFFLPINNRVG
jgi:hypothetical protein